MSTLITFWRLICGVATVFMGVRLWIEARAVVGFDPGLAIFAPIALAAFGLAIIASAFEERL